MVIRCRRKPEAFRLAIPVQTPGWELFQTQAASPQHPWETQHCTALSQRRQEKSTTTTPSILAGSFPSLHVASFCYDEVQEKGNINLAHRGGTASVAVVAGERDGLLLLVAREVQLRGGAPGTLRAVSTGSPGTQALPGSGSCCRPPTRQQGRVRELPA